MGAPSFDIPARPERHFPGTGGVEYRGGTVFELVPAAGEVAGSTADEPSDADRTEANRSDVDRPDVDRTDADLAETDLADADLVQTVDEVLGAGPYQYGDFHELPMPLWLVRDRETGDAFRVAVRNGEVQLHVLPRTDAPGLRAFYERLETASEDHCWRVRVRQKE